MLAFGLNYQLRDLSSELVSDVLVKIIIFFQRISPSTAHFFSSRGLSATFSTKEQDLLWKVFLGFWKKIRPFWGRAFAFVQKTITRTGPHDSFKKHGHTSIKNLWAFWPAVHFSQVSMHQLLFSAHCEHAHLQSNSHAPGKCTGYRKLNFSCVETHVLALTVVQTFDLSVEGLRTFIDVISPICFSTNLYEKRNY